MDTVITLKAWRRPRMLARVLASLHSNPGASQIQLMISLDSHRFWTVLLTLIIIRSGPFRNSARVVVHRPARGCAGNMRYCFYYAFEVMDAAYMIHLEDDTVAGRDFLAWMQWAGRIADSRRLFAVCPFTRRDERRPSCTLQVQSAYLKDHFQCGGGFGMVRREYERMLAMGGIFGVRGNVNTELEPLRWKESVTISDRGSWAWPFNKYFRQGRACISPTVSRTNNIGFRRGVFNPDSHWHGNHVYDPYWIESEWFRNAEIDSGTYRLCTARGAA